MKFLFPQFLWALVALSIPIIIHLFNFQRPKKVFFSNIALLENIRSQTASVQKLKHLLILLSRLLFIAFLVMAFAQPFLSPLMDSSDNNEKTVKVFYLDNSYSMQQEKDGMTLLENAVAGLENFGGLIQSNEEVYFLDNDFKAKDLYPYTKSTFMDRLSDVNESFSFRGLDDVLARIEQIEHKGKKEIFIISDLQKSTLGDLSSLDIDSNNFYHIIPIQNSITDNISIDSVWLEKPFVFENRENNLIVELRYHGEAQVENFPVKLFIDSSQIAASNISFSAQSNSRLKFSLPPSSDNIKLGMIQIDDSPVYFDNEHYFTLRPNRNISISVLGASENKYLKAIFQTEDFFDYRFMSSGSPDYKHMKSSDFIILDALIDYPQYLRTFLLDYCNEGGHLLILSGKDNSSLIGILNDFSIKRVKPTDSQVLQTLSDPDLKNPFFEGVFQRFEKNTDMPDALPLLEIKDFGVVHLKFADGTAFLGEKDLKKGKIFVVTGDLSETKSNFYRHSIFVPVMFKMLTSAIKTSANELAYNFGRKSIQWEMPETQNMESALKLVGKELTFIPDQRPSSEGIIFDLPTEKMQPGFYKVERKDTIISQIAINADKRESNLETYSGEESITLMPANKNILLDQSGEMTSFVESYKETRFGTALWKYFLICSLIFLTAEIFLIRLL